MCAPFKDKSTSIFFITRGKLGNKAWFPTGKDRGVADKFDDGGCTNAGFARLGFASRAIGHGDSDAFFLYCKRRIESAVGEFRLNVTYVVGCSPDGEIIMVPPNEPSNIGSFDVFESKSFRDGASTNIKGEEVSTRCFEVIIFTGRLYEFLGWR